MDTPTVKFNTTNLTNQVTLPVSGISFVRGRAMRGPYDQPDTVFYNFKQWSETYGGLTDEDTPLLVQRLLDKGCPIRFSRIGHYTTIGQRETLTALKATADTEILFTDEEEVEAELFKLNLKYPGVDYNNVVVIISDASNGDADYFNLAINHVNDASLNRSYQNLVISGNPTIGESNYLKKVTDNNPLVDVQYLNLSTLTGTIRPENATIAYTGGTDGGAITDVDIIGASASNTGFFSFDEYEDTYQLMVIGASTAVGIAGEAYAKTRQDLQYWHFLGNENANETAYIAERTALGFNSKYAALFGGGLKVLDAFTGQTEEIEAITDIAALAALSEENSGINLSFAGNTRGVITNAQGVVNNYGTVGKRAALNLLANRQINMIVAKDGLIKLQSNFSAQLEENQESFNSIVRLIMYIKKALRPTLEKYLEEPNEQSTWLRLYYEVKPFFEKLGTARALNKWEWNGDQYSRGPQDYSVNNAPDVSLGKYKVSLILGVIPGMQQIEVNIFLTDGTLTIEDVNQLT